MEKLKSFNRTACRMVSAGIEKELLELGKRYGISIKAAGGTFSPTDYTLKLEISTINQDGEVETKYATAFKKSGFMYGFKETDLYKTFTTGSGTYKIMGLNTRARKYPIVAEKVGTMKQYKMTTSQVLSALKRSV